jgi:hypothetical protein
MGPILARKDLSILEEHADELERPDQQPDLVI